MGDWIPAFAGMTKGGREEEIPICLGDDVFGVGEGGAHTAAGKGGRQPADVVEVEMGDDNGVDGFRVYATLPHFAEQISGSPACVRNGGRAQAGVDKDSLALGFQKEGSDVYSSVDLAIIVHVAFEVSEGIYGLVGEEITGVYGHEAVGYGENTYRTDVDTLDGHGTSGLVMVGVGVAWSMETL